MLTKKYPLIKKNILLTVAAITVVFLAAGLILGLWSARDMRKLVAEQFNEEQMVIARNVSTLVERELGLLKKELLLLSRDLPPTPFDPEKTSGLIQGAFARVMESGVWKIIVEDPAEPSAFVFAPHRGWTRQEGADLSPRAAAPADNAADGGIRISTPLAEQATLTLVLETAPLKPDSLRVAFQVNLTWLLSPLFSPLRSGKTGYVWMIDANGTFLYHPQTDFIGKNSFDVRDGRYPGVALGLIKFIQKERMLDGQAGTGWYYSGWHRGITGNIKKLIAYHPVTVSENPPQKWSVAVVAPVSEIDDALAKGYLTQFLLQGLIMMVVILGAGSILFFEMRWSRALENRVGERTEELKKSEEKYRSLVESAEDFIFTLDAEGKFQSMNSFTANFFGGRPEAFIGQSLANLFTDSVAERQLKLVHLVYSHGKSVRDEFEIGMGEHPIWISANFMPLKNEAGAVSAVLCIARDITENKHLEKQLINTEKLASMGTLAAGVAHEINNPLGVILGFCDLLLRKAEAGSQTHEDLKTIERQGLLCKQVVENLLSFARVGTGVSEHSDLNACLHEIIKVVRHTLDMNEIELDLQLAEELPPVEGDSRQLQQVFLNLINNAVAAMKNGGRLTVRSALEKGTRKAVIQIQDSGSGIRPEDVDHIYEPFFTTKPEGEGTGLGLFVSYGIIAKNGGTIDCVSHPADSAETPSGTTFTLKLVCRS